jgi:potassium-dependent mechanosensitive channel
MLRHVVSSLVFVVLVGAPWPGSPAPLNPPPAAPAPAKAPATPGPPSIPVPEVAGRAEEVAKLLRDFDALLGRTTTETIEKRLPEFSARIAAQAEATGRQLDAAPVGAVLDEVTSQWQATRAELMGYVNILTERATGLERALERLSALRETWTRGRADAQASRAPAQVIERIDGVLTAIAATRSRLQQQRSVILVLQDRVAQEVARCESMLEWIARTRQAASGGLTERDGVPVWQAGQLALATRELPARVRSAITADLAQMHAFARDRRGTLPLHVALFLGLLLLTWTARRRARVWISSGEAPGASLRVLERPASAALVLSLLASVSVSALTYGPAIPRAAAALIQVLALVPALRIMRLLVDPRRVTALYVFGAFFLADLVRHFTSVIPLLEQQVFLLESLAAALLLAGWALVRWLRPAQEAGLAETQGLLRPVSVAALFLVFSVAFVAGGAGYMRLALLLGSGVLGSGYIALVLYAAIRVGDGLVAFGLRVPPLCHLAMARHHRPLLERRAHGLLRGLAIGAWVFFALRYFSLWTSAVSLAETALAAELRRGALSVSLADVLVLVVTVGAVFVLSSVLRFVLEEDVYPRLNLGRGLPHSLSSLLHYTLLLTGFLLALGLLGVDFTKITILVGAFGVGIGFGLQSVVNNFVSGLIVMFERRIDVGDALQIGEVSGQLRRLGARACTVRTWEGAEVIVPNASLVSGNVTNWTLSDRSRRIDLPLGVAYGTSPEKVIDVLLGVARAHREVQSEPPPMALFLGFGDSALQFELRVWAGQFDRWAQIRSELSVALYAALGEAGIEIPFPQREVRLRHV